MPKYKFLIMKPTDIHGREVREMKLNDDNEAIRKCCEISVEFGSEYFVKCRRVHKLNGVEWDDEICIRRVLESKTEKM